MAGQRLTDKTAHEEQAGSGDLLMLVDVSDTTGSSAGTSKKTDFKYVIQTDKFSLSNADVLALDSKPKNISWCIKWLYGHCFKCICIRHLRYTNGDSKKKFNFWL